MSKRVVIVDDSKFIVRQLMKFYREEMKYDVVATGSSGQDAIELYKSFKPDLLSLDIVMAEMTGLDAVKAIIDEFPDAVIMMVSAVRTGEMLDCITAGAKGYVEKPLQFNSAEYVEDFKETLAEIFEE